MSPLIIGPEALVTIGLAAIVIDQLELKLQARASSPFRSHSPPRYLAVSMIARASLLMLSLAVPSLRSGTLARSVVPVKTCHLPWRMEPAAVTIEVNWRWPAAGACFWLAIIGFCSE